MKILKTAIVIGSATLMLAACSQEEQKLPDLPHIEAPKDIAGTYVGRVPTESAKTHQIRAELDSNGTAIITHSVLLDTVQTYSDTLAYSATAETLSFKFSDKTWNFKKNGDFGYLFMNPQGEAYVDANGSNFILLRILQNVQKPAEQKPAEQGAK